MSAPMGVPDCICGDEIDVGHKPQCPQGIFLRREGRKVERAYQQTERAFKRSLHLAATKMLDALLKQMMDDLVLHAAEGRGFRVNLQIVEANGMPWKPAPPEEPRERLIIAPHEQ